MKLSIFQYGQTSGTLQNSEKIVEWLEIPTKEKSKMNERLKQVSDYNSK